MQGNIYLLNDTTWIYDSQTIYIFSDLRVFSVVKVEGSSISIADTKNKVTLKKKLNIPGKYY